MAIGSSCFKYTYLQQNGLADVYENVLIVPEGLSHSEIEILVPGEGTLIDAGTHTHSRYNKLHKSQSHCSRFSG